MKELFLDANAHLPVFPETLKAYIEFNQSKAGHGHPSSLSEPGREAATALEEARAKIAKLIGADSPHQIIFTSTCTQAAEWGLRILLNIAPEIKNNIIVSPVEHPAVSEAIDHLIGEKYKESLNKLEVNSEGEVQPPKNDSFNYFMGKKIICTHLQNETGVIQPLTLIKNSFEKKPLLFADISQSLGKIPLNVNDLEIDIAIAGAHKFGGLGGVGFIYLRDSKWYLPFGTGSRYFMDRPGTPDVAAIVASSLALEKALETLPTRTLKMTQFNSIIESGLKERGFKIIGQGANRCPNTSFIYKKGQAGVLLLTLGAKGIHVGLGSACGSMHTDISQSIKALGLTGTTHDYLRISQWGEYGEAEAKYFLKVLDEV